MKIDFNLKGADAFDEMLKQLPPRVASRVANNALRAGARVMNNEAKRLVPVKTGELKASLKVRTRRPKNPAIKAVSFGVRGKEGPLAHLIEFGTSPHPIFSNQGPLSLDHNGQPVVNKEGRATYVLDKVQHPGFSPKPFIRPAGDSMASQAVDQIGKTLGTGIEREAAKLAASIKR
jgi:HK97 gp10 family phage protein